MSILIAPDKFRGTATASQAAAAISAGVEAAGRRPIVLPLSDGGEGILDTLGGPNRTSEVTSANGEPVAAGWRLDNGVAVIETALVAGLLLAGGRELNDAWNADTTGVGELLVEAVDQGATRILLGLGGSATTDGGRGALAVLLANRHVVDLMATGRLPEIIVCCDVRTSFVDAARIFAPQKGADPDMVKALEHRLINLGSRYLRDFGIDIHSVPGAGAAGGLAGGLAAIGARLTPGFDVVADTLGLDDALYAADLVITGEGLMDEASFDGKVVGGVATRARRQGVPVLVIAGDVQVDVAQDQLTAISLVERFGKHAALTRTADCLRQATLDHLEPAVQSLEEVVDEMGEVTVAR